MNKGQLRRGCAALVLSCLIALPSNGISNSTASAQVQEAKDFRDDFAGTSLRPEWTIVDQDANRWALVDNDYLLLVLKDEKNRFCYAGTIPDRYEFTATSLVTERLESSFYPTGAIAGAFELFYIGIRNTSNEGVTLMISTDNGKDTWVFQKRVGNDIASVLKSGDKASQPSFLLFSR